MSEDLYKVVPHLVMFGAGSFYPWFSMLSAITKCVVSECFLNPFKETTNDALHPTPRREREKRKQSS